MELMVFFAIVFFVNILLTINNLENSTNLMVRFSKKKTHHTLFIINQINKHSREIKGKKKMGLKKEKKVFMKNKGLL
jgi:hypothetical protein